MDDRFKVPAAKKLSLDTSPNDHEMPNNQSATINHETRFVAAKKLPIPVNQTHLSVYKSSAAKKQQLNNSSAKKLLEIEPERQKATSSRELFRDFDSRQVIKGQSSVGIRFNSQQSKDENKPSGSKDFHRNEYAVSSGAMLQGGAYAKRDNRQKAYALMADYTQKLWQTRNNEALARSHNLKYEFSHSKGVYLHLWYIFILASLDPL